MRLKVTGTGMGPYQEGEVFLPQFRVQTVVGCRPEVECVEER